MWRQIVSCQRHLRFGQPAGDVSGWCGGAACHPHALALLRVALPACSPPGAAIAQAAPDKPRSMEMRSMLRALAVALEGCIFCQRDIGVSRILPGCKSQMSTSMCRGWVTKLSASCMPGAGLRLGHPCKGSIVWRVCFSLSTGLQDVNRAVFLRQIHIQNFLFPLADVQRECFHPFGLL